MVGEPFATLMADSTTDPAATSCAEGASRVHSPIVTRPIRRPPSRRSTGVPPIWWAVGLGVLVIVLIVVGWSVQRAGDGAGDDVVPDTAGNGQPTATASVDTAGPAGLAADPSVVNGTPGAGPVSVGGTTIGTIVWASEVDPATQAPAGALETIPDNVAEIYAALPLTSIAAGSVVSASWSYNGVPLDTLTSAVTASTATTDTWVAFRLDRVDSGTPAPRSDEDWPDGEYGVVITVDGQVVQESTVTVEESF